MRKLRKSTIRSRSVTRFDSLSVFWMFFSLLIILNTSPCLSQEFTSVINDPHNTHKLALDECLSQMLEANFDIILSKVDYQSIQENIRLAKSVFDPSSTFSAGIRTSETKLSAENSYVYGGIDSYDSETTLFDASLSQAFITGGSYSLSFGTDMNTGTFITEAGPDYDGDGVADDLDGDGIPDTKESQEYNTSFSLSLAHPLLRNFGIAVNTGNIVLAKNNSDMSLLGLQQTIINSVSAVQNRYWELVLTLKNLEVWQKSLKLAQDFQELTEARVKLGTLPPIEIVIAEAEVANREQGIINAINIVKNSEDNLRQIMNVPYDDMMWSKQLIPVTQLDFQPIEIDNEQAIQTAFEKRLDYQQSLLKLQNSELSLKMAKNAALPGLDLNTSVTLSDVENDFGEAFSGTFSGDSYTIYGGLSLEIPWRNRSALASKVQAEYALDKANIEHKKLEDLIRLEVRFAVRELEKNMKQIKAAQKALELAEKKLEAEQKKYEIGISTSFNVIEYQKDLAQAQSDEMAAIIAYKKSVVSLYQTLGTTLEQNQITFDPSIKDSDLDQMKPE